MRPGKGRLKDTFVDTRLEINAGDNYSYRIDPLSCAIWQVLYVVLLLIAKCSRSIQTLASQG